MAAPTAATSSRAPPPTPRSMSSRRKGWSPTPGSVATSSSPGCGRWPAEYPSIGDARGLGLMVAIELVKPGVGDGRTPDPELTKRIQAEALARKLIVLTAGTYVNVVRIIPPLVTTADEVDLALAILDDSLAAAGAAEPRRDERGPAARRTTVRVARRSRGSSTQSARTASRPRALLAASRVRPARRGSGARDGRVTARDFRRRRRRGPPRPRREGLGELGRDRMARSTRSRRVRQGRGSRCRHRGGVRTYADHRTVETIAAPGSSCGLRRSGRRPRSPGGSSTARIAAGSDWHSAAVRLVSLARARG